MDETEQYEVSPAYTVIVDSPAWAYVILTENMVTAYFSTLLTTDNRRFKPMWELLNKQCWFQHPAEIEKDDEMYGLESMWVNYILLDECPGVECGLHGWMAGLRHDL